VCAQAVADVYLLPLSVVPEGLKLADRFGEQTAPFGIAILYTTKNNENRYSVAARLEVSSDTLPPPNELVPFEYRVEVSDQSARGDQCHRLFADAVPKMAQGAVDQAETMVGLEKRPCRIAPQNYFGRMWPVITSKKHLY
jgi:hypothetical protein